MVSKSKNTKRKFEMASKQQADIMEIYFDWI